MLIRNFVVAAFFALVLPWAAANAADLSQTRQFSITPQLLADALMRYSEQSGVQVTSPAQLLKGKSSSGVVGSYSAQVALEQLLKGTDLAYQVIGTGTVTIRASGNTPVAPKSTRADDEAQPSAIVLARVEANEKPVAGTTTAKAAEQSESEMVVTGTNIRGAVPAGSKLIVIDRKEIERAGFTSAAEIVRAQSQNYNGGPNEDSAGQNAGAANRGSGGNSYQGTAPNLRGMGASSTLVLIDGHRLALGGALGLFTDISGIPVRAIERVEILSDGASALYGSDAIGGVVNYILRKDYSGMETHVRFGSTTAAGMRDYGVNQSFGMHWDSGRAMLSVDFNHRDSLRFTDRPFSASSDQRARGGSNFNSFYYGAPGTLLLSDFVTNYAIPPGQDGTDLDAADFAGRADTISETNAAEGGWMLPDQQSMGFVGSVRQNFGEKVGLSAQVLSNTRSLEGRNSMTSDFLYLPSTSPFYVNPTGGADMIYIYYSVGRDIPELLRYTTDSRTLSSALALDIDLAADWQMKVGAAYARDRSTHNSTVLDSIALDNALFATNPAQAFNPMGDGTGNNPAVLAQIAGGMRADLDSTLRTASVIANGPVFRIGGNAVRLAVGGEQRRTQFDYLSKPLFSTPLNLSLQRSYERTVDAAFAELMVPFVGAANRRAGIHSLVLSLAGRHEDSSDFGTSAVPRVGLSYAPMAGLTLRASWSETFRAPDLTSLDPSTAFYQLTNVFDPQSTSPFGFSPILLMTGGNAGLQAEEATVWTTGFDIAPAALPGLTVGMSYFNIDFTNRLQGPLSGVATNEWLANPLYAPFITRNPTAAQRQAACQSTPNPPVNCLTVPIVALVDGRQANTAVSQTDGIDLNGAYAFSSAAGELSFTLGATYLLSYDQALIAGAPLSSFLNIQNNPVNLRLRGSVSWSRDRLRAGAYVNHTDAYRFRTTIGPSVTYRPIDSWTSVDLTAGYQLPEMRGPFSGISVALNVQNAFDQDPPFVNFLVGYDTANFDPVGRVIRVQASKRW